MDALVNREAGKPRAIPAANILGDPSRFGPEAIARFRYGTLSVWRESLECGRGEGVHGRQARY